MNLTNDLEKLDAQIEHVMHLLDGLPPDHEYTEEELDAIDDIKVSAESLAAACREMLDDILS